MTTSIIAATDIRSTATDTTPTAPAPTTSRVWIRRVAGLATTFVLAIAMALGLAAPASATSWVASAGRPGPVAPVVAQGVTTYYRVPGALYGSQVRAIQVNGPRVYRSPATSGAQTVTYTFNISRWTGSTWVVVAQGWSSSATIPQGVSSVAFAAQIVRTSVVGYYRVMMGFGWRSANGATVGTSILQYSQAGDYQCRIGGCATGPGWINI
jgi:hypothetical protein